MLRTPVKSCADISWKGDPRSGELVDGRFLAIQRNQEPCRPPLRSALAMDVRKNAFVSSRRTAPARPAPPTASAMPAARPRSRPPPRPTRVRPGRRSPSPRPAHGPGGTPTGTMTFRDGGVTLATVALAGGTAAFTTAKLSVGTHAITAAYSGDASFPATTSAVLQQAVSVPTDSLKARALQIVASDLVATNSGAAITGAVDGAINDAFNGGGNSRDDRAERGDAELHRRAALGCAAADRRGVCRAG
jgi:hypothetical protein